MNGRAGWRVASPIFVFGASITGFAIAHVLVGTNEFLPEFLDAGIFLVFASAVVAVGYRVVDEQLEWGL